MTIQLSDAARNGELDAIETAISTSAKLRLYTGTQPATCATAPSGSLLLEMSLPSDYLANASGGSKAKAGTWNGTASGAGTAGYFRVYDSAGTTCHIQGSVTITGGGGDMTLDNNVLAVNQAVTINTFTLTAGNP
jgi:hypothetical protein